MVTPENLFCIEIDYVKDSENPSRVFKCMSMLIDNIQELDNILIQSVSTNIKPVLLLEDVKEGSLRTWLATVLREVNDDALKNLDWKPLIGQYLVKAKYYIIDFVNGRTEITNKEEIGELQKGLLDIASETKVNQLGFYSPLNTKNVVKGIGLISTPLEQLNKQDKVRFFTQQDEIGVPFNLEFDFAPEKIEDLLVREILDSTATMILKVKKPDYLGTSMWAFKHGRRLIEAKIQDIEWLTDFQNRKVDIRPGDSIRTSVHISVRYGYDNEVVSSVYEIIKVMDVLPASSIEQTSFFESNIKLLTDEDDDEELTR